jgi:hypothetical protein
MFNLWREIKCHNWLNLSDFPSSYRLIVLLDRILPVVLALLKLLHGRDLHMGNHEPIVVGVGEIDGAIVGVSLFAFGVEVDVAGQVEFKLELHGWFNFKLNY